MKTMLKRYSSTLWLCLFIISMPSAYAAAPKSLKAERVFTIEANIGEALMMGETVDGSRLTIPITGGRVYGENIEGTVLPGGGDYQLIHFDGSVELQARYMIKTTDGTLINVSNKGVLIPGTTSRPTYFKTVPEFVAPRGDYQWLNEAIFIGGVRTDENKPEAVLIDIYRVL